MTDVTSPMQPDDLFRMAFVQGGKLAPDGKTVVYAVIRTINAPAADPQDVCALWLADRVTGEQRQLTAGMAFDSAPAWSPDGTRIAFTAKPDAAPPKADAPYRITRSVHRFDRMGNLDRAKQDIFVIEVDAAAPVAADAALRLTDAASSAQSPAWSPDGTRLLYFAFMPPDTFNLFARLYVIPLAADADGARAPYDVLGAWGDAVGTAAWTHDGYAIAFIGRPAAAKIGTKSDVYVIRAVGGTPENRTTKLRLHIGNGLQSDYPAAALGLGGIHVTKENDAYIHVQEGGMAHVYRVALAGVESWIAVTNGERACLLQDVRAGDILFAAADFNHPPDLYTISINAEDERRLTRLNTTLLAQIALPTVEHLLFRSSDGALIEGWMLKPSFGAAPYPTILYIHGGPHSGFGHTFSFDFQMLTGAGYAVLIVNQRGSTGYGDDFANAILGDWGNLDYADLMAGVDDAVAQGLADADRLGVCGLSGGGNLSCWTVGQTRRFKAAVPENPLTNWRSFYGVSDIGVWFSFNELGGHPHEIPDTYARCSPITYAHTCTTPTLLIQGEQDWRCPSEQSEQFYTVLKANGCIAEMLRLPNEAHAGALNGLPVTRRAQNAALLNWMDRYVRA